MPIDVHDEVLVVADHRPDEFQAPDVILQWKTTALHLEAMVALSRCVAPVAMLLASVEGARLAKRRSAILTPETPNTKFISGVPILNYHVAYGGESSLSAIEASREEDWIVLMKPGSTDAQIDSLCKSTRKGCKIAGHPDKRGVAFFEMHGTERELEEVINRANGAIKVVEPNQPMNMIPELL